MDAHNDDDHQKDKPQHTKQNKLVLPDPIHHSLHYLPTSRQIVPHPPDLLPVIDQPTCMILQLLSYTVTHVQGIGHDPDPVFQLVSCVRHHFALL